MNENRLCPMCSEPLGADPRQRWCGGRCRRRVSDQGGPLAVAELKETWTGEWERASDFSNPNRLSIAAQLRAEATRLRELDRPTR